MQIAGQGRAGLGLGCAIDRLLCMGTFLYLTILGVL